MRDGLAFTSRNTHHASLAAPSSYHPRMVLSRRRSPIPGLLALLIMGSLIAALGVWLFAPDLIKGMASRLAPPRGAGPGLGPLRLPAFVDEVGDLAGLLGRHALRQRPRPAAAAGSAAEHLRRPPNRGHRHRLLLHERRPVDRRSGRARPGRRRRRRRGEHVPARHLPAPPA